jgi:UDP-glucose 4-epimerase
MRKQVLITGGCGFIGSNLIDALIKRGYPPINITVIDNLSSESSSIEYRRDDIDYILDDAKELGNYTNSSFDIIFHLAAHARIQPSFEKPYETLQNNIITTTAILDYAYRHNVKKVIYAGSSSFYNGAKKSPYSFSKWVGEETCTLYNLIYGLPVLTARFFNVYGPKQPTNGDFATVIGIFERRCREGNNLPVVGDGTMRRDFTHVEDICKGLIQLAQSGFTSGIYNFGTGKSYSLNEIAGKIISLSRKKIQKVYMPRRRNEAMATCADISKAQADIGYRPEHDLMDYLESVIT